MIPHTHLKIDARQYRKFLLVPDVHGCYKELQKELARHEFDPKVDFVLSLGDMIDRGPRSFEVLDFFDQARTGGWGDALMGNHELRTVEYLTKVTRIAGGVDNLTPEFFSMQLAMVRNYGATDSVFYPYKYLRYMDFLLSLWSVATISVGDLTVGCVHAEPPRVWSASCFEDMHIDALTESFRLFGSKSESFVAGIDMVFCGHACTQRLTTYGNRVYLDRGIGTVKDGLLRVVDLNDAEFMDLVSSKIALSRKAC